ncbi:MAG: ABC transporter permease [Chryseolinea sp.]
MMIRNYFITSLRNLAREKTNTIINIVGLTLGITGSLVLFLIVKHGTSYDTYHTNKDRIYRVVTKSKGNDGYNFTQGIPFALPEAFKNDFAEAEEVAFTSFQRGSLITITQANGQVKKYEEGKGLVFTEPSFFKIFDRKILIGSADKGLDDPNEAIISKKWALKYFSKEDVINELITYNNIEYKIAAVMEDFPTNTDLPFDLMLSSITIKKQLDERGWAGISDTDNCYVLLKDNKSVANVEARMEAFVKTHIGNGGKDIPENTFIMQPLTDLHSDNRFSNYNKKLPKAAQIGFAVIAVFLLITACINFINLTTAEAVKRTREVGIRKVLGSTRKQLILKFMGEAFLVTIIALTLSLAVAQVLLGFMNSFMELSLTLNLTDIKVWGFLGVLTIIVTLFAGLYPAIVVSAFKPALAIRNQINSNRSSGFTMRRGLVVLQFFISQFFIIGTIVLTQQMDYMHKQDIGFAKDAIITIPIPVHEEPIGQNGSSKMRTLKNEILRLPGVEKTSLGYAPPSFNAVVGIGFKMVGSADEYDTQVKPIDGDYLGLYSIQLLSGEALTDLDTATGLVVNEKLVKMAGFSNNDEIVGKEISFWGKQLTVKGVVKDFNTQSLEKAIEPVVMLNNISDYKSLSIKLNPSDMQETIHLIQEKWEAAYPEYIFSYKFVDEQIRDLYKGERKISTLLNVFSFIAIFIGCLGLFGLVTFMANQKTKEIGVRKVLGASVQSILFLFSKEFGKLILIGFALAAPAAGFLMHMLLQEFAYKIELGPIIFLTGLFITFCIAFVTVGYRSFRASTVNPVQSLRSE